MLRRFHDPPQAAETKRTVAEILDAAAERRHHRAEADRRERAAAEQRRAEKAARAREYLTTLAANPESAWLRVDAFIATKKPREYDQAVELLQDLRELSQRDGTTDQFAADVIRIRDEHARKPSLIARLDHVGLGAPDPRSKRAT
jgi:uncharacterized Zn finger protein